MQEKERKTGPYSEMELKYPIVTKNPDGTITAETIRHGKVEVFLSSIGFLPVYFYPNAVVPGRYYVIATADVVVMETTRDYRQNRGDIIFYPPSGDIVFSNDLDQDTTQA